MIKLSAGLSSAILGDYGLARMMDNGVIDIYSGSPPEFAHFAPTGTRLARVTQDGGVFVAGSPANGLRLDRTEPGALKNFGNWVLKGMASGQAGWWRWKWYLDDPDLTNTYYPRLDGIVGESLVLANTSITPATNIVVDSFYLTLGAA